MSTASSPTAPASDEIVELNVGGFRFTTTRSTLCRVKGSYLEAMFSDRHLVPALLKDGSSFIDRDGRWVKEMGKSPVSVMLFCSHL